MTARRAVEAAYVRLQPITGLVLVAVAVGNASSSARRRSGTRACTQAAARAMHMEVRRQGNGNLVQVREPCKPPAQKKAVLADGTAARCRSKQQHVPKTATLPPSVVSTDSSTSHSVMLCVQRFRERGCAVAGRWSRTRREVYAVFSAPPPATDPGRIAWPGIRARAVHLHLGDG